MGHNPPQQLQAQFVGEHIVSNLPGQGWTRERGRALWQRSNCLCEIQAYTPKPESKTQLRLPVETMRFTALAPAAEAPCLLTVLAGTPHHLTQSFLLCLHPTIFILHPVSSVSLHQPRWGEQVGMVKAASLRASVQSPAVTCAVKK